VDVRTSGLTRPSYGLKQQKEHQSWLERWNFKVDAAIESDRWWSLDDQIYWRSLTIFSELQA